MTKNSFVADVTFNVRSHFSLLIGNGVKALLFLVWAIVHQGILIIEKKKVILILRKGPIDRLDDTKYSVNITKSSKKIASVYTTMQATVSCMLMV